MNSVSLFDPIPGEHWAWQFTSTQSTVQESARFNIIPLAILNQVNINQPDIDNRIKLIFNFIFDTISMLWVSPTHLAPPAFAYCTCLKARAHIYTARACAVKLWREPEVDISPTPRAVAKCSYNNNYSASLLNHSSLRYLFCRSRYIFFPASGAFPSSPTRIWRPREFWWSLSMVGKSRELSVREITSSRNLGRPPATEFL